VLPAVLAAGAVVGAGAGETAVWTRPALAAFQVLACNTTGCLSLHVQRGIEYKYPFLPSF